MTDAEGSSLVCQRLRCEHRIDPIGLDVERPRFGWIVAGEGRGRRQTAYRVTVDAIGASNDPVWDSGKIDSSLTVDIDYEGRPLQPFTRYRWSVRSWDEAGRPSEVEAATFETGLLGLPWPAGWLAQAEPGPEQWEAPEGYPYDNEFQARPPVYFRKAVLLKATPRAARIYATALGV